MISGRGLLLTRAAMLAGPVSWTRRLQAARKLVLMSLCLGLAACAEFPEVARMEGAAGPPPVLQPLDGLLSEAGITADPAPALAARAAALRARALAIGAP